MSYLDEEGWMAAGLVATGVAPVNRASFVVEPVEGFHQLRFMLSFAPEGVAFDTPAVGGTVRFRMTLMLYDAETGDALLPAPARFDAPGTLIWVAPDERPVRAELTLLQGADVSYRLRVTALPDPAPL